MSDTPDTTKLSEKPLDYDHLRVFLKRMDTEDGFAALVELASMNDVDSEGIEDFMSQWSCQRIEQTHDLQETGGRP